MLRNPPAVLGVSNLVLRHAWWTIHATPSEVISYVQAHPEKGGTFDQSGSGGGPGQPSQAFVGFSFPAVAGVLGTRWLLVEVVPLRDGMTGIRADAEVQWLIPRPANEKVPAGVGVIDIVRAGPGQPPPVSKTVTTPPKVRRIIKLIDRLPIVQPGSYHCPPQTAGPTDTFTFRATRHGSPLAVASVPAGVGNTQTPCDPMSFEVRGRQEPGLSQARDFLQAVQELLGIQLTSKSGNSTGH